MKHLCWFYATFPEESKHIYNYAKWDGVSWQNNKVCDAGSWFPRFEKKKEPVIKVMEAVADWQIANFDKVKHHPLHWTNGALYRGMYAWSAFADTNKYRDWLLKIGREYQWQPGFRMYHADDFVVLQTWIDQYRELGNERMLDPSIARTDWIIEHPFKNSLSLFDKGPHDRWWWCDALFMAPPVYVQLTSITGDKKYVKFMNKEYQATYYYLYDQEEHLLYRDDRYFDKREANGKKIFWGRGNGWVMGGLVSILKELPENSKYRPFYEKLFKEMLAKSASLQDDNGYWHASLLDPGSYPNPETSSSSFITYALAYGVNSGLLDREEYLPVVKKVNKDMTEIYGIGAFLLAGSELIKLAD